MSVVPSAKGFEKTLRDETDDAGRRAGDAAGENFSGAFGGGLKKLAAVAAAAFAGLEIGRFLKGSVDAASDLSESMSKVGVVFGDSAGEVQSWAKTSAAAMGQSSQAALEAAGTLGNLFVSLKLPQPEAAKMSKKMVELAGDLASFNNVSPEEALDALRSGLVGETEPLRRFGVNLSDATLKAKAMELGLSDGKATLDANAKAQASYALILEQTGTAQGDFARTSSGLANQQRIAAAQFENLKAVIGNAFLPLLVSSGHVLTTTVLPALTRFAELAGPVVTEALRDAKAEFDRFVDTLKTGMTENDVATPFERVAIVIRELVGSVREFLATLKTGLTENDVATPLENVALKIRAVFDVVKENKGAFEAAAAGVVTFVAALQTVKAASAGISGAQGIISTLSAAGPALAPLLANPLGLVVAAIAAVGVAAFVAYKKFQPFRDIVDNVGRVIRDVAVAAFHALVDAAVAIGGAVGTAFEAVRNAVDVVLAKFEAFGALIGRLFSIVVVALTPLAQWINDNVVATINAGLELVAALFERVQERVTTVVNLMLAVLIPVFTALKAQFEIFATVATTVVQVLATVIADTVAFWVAAFRTFIDIVTPIWVGFFQNILTVAETVINVVKVVIESVLGVIRGIFQAITGLVSGDWSKFWEGIKTIASSLFGGVTGIVSAIWAGILGIFSNAIATVQNTVTNGFNAVVSFVSGIPGRIASSIGSLTGILFSAGQDLIRGLLNGINSMVDAAASAARRVAQAAANAVKSVFGIGSPSKLFMGYGVNVVEGFIIGIEKTGSQVAGAVSDVFGAQRFVTAPGIALPPVQAVAGGGSGGSPTINIYAPLGVDRQEVISSVQAGLRQYNSARAGTR